MKKHIVLIVVTISLIIAGFWGAPQFKSLSDHDSLKDMRSPSYELQANAKTPFKSATVADDLVTPKKVILSCKEKNEDFTEPKEMESIIAALKANNSFKSRMASALLPAGEFFDFDRTTDKDVKRGLSLLNALSVEFPENNMIHYFLVAECIQESTQEVCGKTAIDRAIKYDAHNGSLWFLISIIKSKNGDLEGAISALEQLVVAPNFDEYWAEGIELFSTALYENGLISDTERMIASIGFTAATIVPNPTALFNLCKGNSWERGDVAQLCLEAGDSLFLRSETRLNKALGLALKNTVYEVLKDEENMALSKNLSKQMSMSTVDQAKAFQLMIYDTYLLNYWFEKLKLHGEDEASLYLVDEAIRLSSNPDYDPCRN